MIQPARAIAWEIFQRFRWIFIVSGALLPISCLIHIIFARSYPELVQFFEGMAALLSMLAIAVAFFFCEVDEKTRTTGFPTRLYVLPLATVKLISLPILYGSLTLLGVYLIWGTFLELQWNYPIRQDQVLCYAAVIPAILVSFQTVFWSLRRFDWIRAILLFGMAWGWLALLIAASGDQPLLRPIALMQISLVGFFVFYFTAFLSVKRERCGEWKGGAERLFQRIFDLLPWRNRAFADMHAAQSWLEWRRRGWVLILIYGLQSAVTIMLVPLPVALYLSSTAVLVGLALFPLSLLWLSGFIGTGLAKFDGMGTTWNLPIFIGVRPISTGHLVLAKFKIAFRTVMLGLLIVALAAYPAMQSVRFFHDLNLLVMDYWRNFPWDHRALAHYLSNPVVLLLVPALAWHNMVAGMYPGLSGNHRKAGWHMALNGSILILVLGTGSWCFRHPEYLPFLLRVLGPISVGWLILKWIRAVQSFSTLRKTTIFTKEQYLSLAILWCLLTAAVCYAGWLASTLHGLPLPMILFFTVWLLPGPEISGCGLNLAANRHR